jgi:hypothetical protein
LPPLAVQGRKLVARGTTTTVALRGVTLTSGVWFYDPSDVHAHSPSDLLFMQGAEDFARIRGWGATAVTLYLDGNWFETEASPGWAWMDETLGWAREQRLYVVPSLVVYPVGGLRGGEGFWASAQAQTQVEAFWRTFAQRYAGVPELAGLDVLNEPQGTDPATIAAYQTRLVDAVRGADPDRIVFIEPRWGHASELTAVARPGLVYDVHDYDPEAFTSQGWPWMWGGGVVTPQGWPGDFVTSLVQTQDPALTAVAVEAGTADWTQVIAGPFTAPAGAGYAFARFFSYQDPAATVWLDDLEVRRVHGTTLSFWGPVGNGSFEARNDFTAEAAYWLPYAGGAGGAVRASDAAHGGAWSARFHGCTGWCEYALFQPGSLATAGGTAVEPGDQVTYRFWVKTQAASAGRNGLQLVWATPTVEHWDRDRLHQALSDTVGAFSLAHGVPAFVGELTPSLVGPRPDILTYLGDALDWLDASGVGWTFYEYRDTYDAGRAYMGLYNGPFGTATAGCTEDAEVLAVVRQHL